MAGLVFLSVFGCWRALAKWNGVGGFSEIKILLLLLPNRSFSVKKSSRTQKQVIAGEKKRPLSV